MMLSTPSPTLVWFLGGIFGILIAATVMVGVLDRMSRDRDYAQLRLRVRSWWVMAGIFTLAIALSRRISIVFLAFVSYLTLKEYFSLIPTRRADRRVLFWAYLTIPFQYYWAATGWYGMFIIFVPVYAFLFLPLRMLVVGETGGFLRAVGTIHWGLMTTVFSLSHAAYLLSLPPGVNQTGGPGLLLYLVFLTQFNDVAQFIWGKILGGAKVIPRVSPGKTWAGLVGGAATTVALAVVLGPWLTPLESLEAAGAGLLIGLGGFTGDVTISALKRDLGVKDSGQMLPGHGGILDRVDSLTYTAPLFFHFIFYLHY